MPVMADCQFRYRTKWKISRSGIRKRTVLEMGAITGNGNAISRTGKLRVWVLTSALFVFFLWYVGFVCITPCPQVPHPHNPQLAEPCHFFSKKKGLLFLLIDHPARPIGRGGSNQRELLASPDIPSPCASLGTFFFR